jgi:hypothetical protein
LDSDPVDEVVEPADTGPVEPAEDEADTTEVGLIMVLA